MALTLPDRPAQYFIDQVLYPAWDGTDARGYNLADDGPVSTSEIVVAATIDDVGAVYPSLIVQYSNETSGGESTYDFMTATGPGQNRTGTLLVTARAQDDADGYVGNSNQYNTADADDIVYEIVAAVENVAQRRAHAPDSEFDTIGSQRGPDAPDDVDEDPPVRIAQTQIAYSWSRKP